MRWDCTYTHNGLTGHCHVFAESEKEARAITKRLLDAYVGQHEIIAAEVIEPNES